MDSESQKKLVIDTLEDMKGQDIETLNVKDMTSVADYMIVVTGTSSRHVKSLAEEISRKFKEQGRMVRMEGELQAEWILLDLGDVLVHVMQKAARQLYDLESLWSIGAGRKE